MWDSIRRDRFAPSVSSGGVKMRGISALMFPAGLWPFIKPRQSSSNCASHSQLKLHYVEANDHSVFSIILVILEWTCNAFSVRIDVSYMLGGADLLHIRLSGSSTPLSAQALSRQNSNPSAVDQQWALEEVRRIARLQQAARELGFDLPSQCYRR